MTKHNTGLSKELAIKLAKKAKTLDYFKPVRTKVPAKLKTK